MSETRPETERVSFDPDSLVDDSRTGLAKRLEKATERIAELERQVAAKDEALEDWVVTFDSFVPRDVKRDHERELSDAQAAKDALSEIVKYLKVAYNSGLVHMKIGGIARYRPIDPEARDELGTLFTLLFNADVALAQSTSEPALGEAATEQEGSAAKEEWNERKSTLPNRANSSSSIQNHRPITGRKC